MGEDVGKTLLEKTDVEGTAELDEVAPTTTLPHSNETNAGEGEVEAELTLDDLEI